MEDQTERHAAIWRFLLGQTSEESAEKTEERIFVEPDFAEEVRIVEGELIDAYRAGGLSPEERRLFELKYLTSPAGLRAVAYEDAFIAFVRAKSEEKRLGGERGRQDAAARAEAETRPPRREKESKWRALAAPLHPLWATRRAAGFSLLAAVILLSAAGIWLQSRRQSADTAGLNPAQAERPSREAELARLNERGADPRGGEVALVTLSPAQRSAGATQRVSVGGGVADGLIRFRLNLTQEARGRYRAVFVDDRRNELFAVSNLTARDTADGPQLWLLVPARYFGGGDYQISLSRAADGDLYTQEGSYSFRVAGAR